MTTATEKAFFHLRHQGVEEPTQTDDFLHPADNNVEGDSLTETQYFGICMPKERIHGLLYFWHHPNLKVLSGGVWVWQGMRPDPLSCEMFDWHTYMSDKLLQRDLHEFRFTNSYAVRVVEPMKHFKVSYSDSKRGNTLNLDYRALGPAVLWGGGGKHFEQPMKVTGDITLLGKRYEVNSYNVRDRSWGKLRPEEHQESPPVDWMTGVFSDDFSFMCTATDDPGLNPDWREIYPSFNSDHTLKSGWIYKDGKVREIVSCKKVTRRHPITLLPELHEMTIVDSARTTYEMTGETIALSVLAPWTNARIPLAMTRWTCDGLVGHGDTQEMQCYDFVRNLMAKGR